MGRCHAQAGRPKRQRVGAAVVEGLAAPPPPDPPAEFDVDEFIAGDEADADPYPDPPPWPDGVQEQVLEALDAQQGGIGMPPAVAAARQLARRLLVHPDWQEWAEGMVRWCEEHYLADVQSLFPVEESFVTPETYRYLRVKALYPGNTFHTELLKEARREPLDLTKVTHSPPYIQICMHLHALQ